MSLSIRTRITLGSLAVAALLLLVALVIVRAQVASVLTEADASLASSDLTSFVQDISADPDGEVDDPGTGVLVLARSPAGVVEVDTLPHDVADVVEHRPAADERFTLTDDEGRTYVIVGRALDTGSGTWSLWAARSTAASELAVRGLDGVLVVGGLVLLAGFGLASWLLTTAALRPVNALRREAESLTADGRLPVPRTRDELAALATTLNGFLEKTQASTDREKRMVSDAAHELRTPLAILTAQLEIPAAERGDPLALAARLEAAGASVDRLAALASNLLELNRLEGRDTAPVGTASDLADEFTDSIDRARVLSVRRQVTVDFTIDTPQPQSAYRCDRVGFGRVVDNLLANALNAVADRGTITAALQQHGDQLVLTIDDNGPGMPNNFLPVAFERFTRADASRGSATGGSGLGLALVRAIAVDAGGTVTAENLTPGLRVTVTMPQM